MLCEVDCLKEVSDTVVASEVKEGGVNLQDSVLVELHLSVQLHVTHAGVKPLEGQLRRRGRRRRRRRRRKEEECRHCCNLCVPNKGHLQKESGYIVDEGVCNWWIPLAFSTPVWMCNTTNTQ